MASWVDASPIQLTPYIQQLPVEAMITVGGELQRRYDVGVEKIQSAIDNIAGLDIIRDVDKAHLQGLMSGVGNTLKTVAMGDFSNYQLVNSMTGMVGKIAKDRNVINAVASTRMYRKGIDDIYTATKEGKNSPSNDWDFMNKASSWLNSKNIGDTFNETYQPYTDYKKHAIDVIKALTKDETITEDAFDIDKKGNLVITDAMVRQKMAGISPEKIQQALMVGLSPSDFKQMQIDGRYNYSNVTPDDFVFSVKGNYTKQIDAYKQQRSVLENAKLSTTSAEVKSDLDSKIANIDKAIKKINTEYGGINDAISRGDIESAKAQLHTANFINGFSSAFSYTETSQTYETSPFAQMQMEREKKEMEWKKFIMNYNQAQSHFQANYSQKEREIEQKERENKLKEKELFGYGGLPTSVLRDDVGTISIDKVVSIVEQSKREIEASDNAFIKQEGKTKDWLLQQEEAWLKNPRAVDPLVAEHFSKTSDLRRKTLSNQMMVLQINEDADKKFPLSVPSNAKDFTISFPSGSYTYSPSEMAILNDKLNNFILYSKVGQNVSPIYLDDKARAELSPKEYYIYQLRKTTTQKGKDALYPAQKALLDYSQDIQKNINLPYQETLSEKNKYINQQIQERLTTSQGGDYGIPLGNAVQKSTFGNVLLSVANLAETQKDAIANSPDLDIDVLRALANNPESATIKVVEGTEFFPSPIYKVTVSGKEGTTRFNLTSEQKNSIFGDAYEPSAPVRAIRPYQEQIRKMGGYSTAFYKGETTPSNSFLNKIDFPSVSNFGVSGNIVTPNGGGLYSIRLNVFDPINKKWHNNLPYPPSGLMTEDQVAVAMYNLNDAAIYKLIYGTIPTATDLKKVQEASKNPL